LRDVLTDSVVDIRVGVMIRAAMSISEEIPLEYKEGKLRQGQGIPHFLPINRKEPTSNESYELPEYTWLTGKKILFCGVPSTILGRTRINQHYVGGASTQEAEIAFVNSLEVWHHQQAAPVVYAPYTPDSVQLEFPDWVSTGKKVSSMYEYVKQQIILEIPRVKEEGQYLRGLLGPTHPIFPYLDVTLLDHYLGRRGKPHPHVKFYSLKLRDGIMIIEPFSPDKWRQSIWVDEDYKWGMAFTAIEHLGYHRGFMYAAVPLPWNMTPDEIELVEKRVPNNLSSWRNERGLIFRNVKAKKKWLIDGKDPISVIPLQNEFVRMGSFHTYDVHRSELAHPVSYCVVSPEISEEWGLCLSMDYYQGFQKIKDIVERVKAVYAED